MEKRDRLRVLWKLSFVMGVLSIVSGCAEMQDSEPQRIATSNERAVVRWLQEYEKAWNLHDTHRLQVMSGLDTGGMLEVQRMFEEHAGLEVKIENVRVREQDGGVVQALYTRRDRWNDPETGRISSSSGAFEHSFRVSDGVVNSYAMKRK